MAPAIEERVAVLETDSVNFKTWQNNQDESIKDLRSDMTKVKDKIDRGLSEMAESFNNKFERFYLLLIGNLVAVIITLATVLVKVH